MCTSIAMAGGYLTPQYGPVHAMIPNPGDVSSLAFPVLLLYDLDLGDVYL